jgi:hypothetical protein
MPHFRVDDGLHSHPKAMGAGDEAMGLWVRAGAYCMHYLTDGFVPDWWVRQQPKGLAKAKKLAAAGLWFAAQRADQDGWAFHEWRQDSKAKVEADRKKARERRGGDVRANVPDEGTPGYVPITHYPEVPNGTPSGAGKPTRRSQVLDEYMPPQKVIDDIKAELPNVTSEQFEYQHRKFIDHWKKTGKAMADWDATWRNWMRNASERGDFRNGNNGQTAYERKTAHNAAVFHALDNDVMRELA